MKLTLLSTSYPRFSGDEASIFVERLAHALSHSGLDCSVVVPLDDKEPISIQDTPVKIERFRYGFFTKGALAFGAGILPNLRRNPLLIFQVPLFLLGFVRKVKQLKPDVIQSNWLFCALAAWVSHLLWKTPYIVTVRGEDLKLTKLPLLGKLFYFPLHQAIAVTSVSEEFLIHLEKTYRLPKEKLHWIPNGVELPTVEEQNTNQFFSKYNLSLDAKYISFVGRLIPLKRLELAIDLLAEPALKDFSLLLCGRAQSPEYLEQLKERAKVKGVLTRTHFLGPVSPAEVVSVLSKSRFFISASEYEGRPNSLLEALCAGVVVLCSDIDAHRSIVKHGKNGVLFNSEELSEAALTLHQIDNNQEQYQAISMAGQDSVKPFSWANCASQYKRLVSRS